MLKKSEHGYYSQFLKILLSAFIANYSEILRFTLFKMMTMVSLIIFYIFLVQIKYVLRSVINKVETLFWQKDQIPSFEH